MPHLANLTHGAHGSMARAEVLTTPGTASGPLVCTRRQAPYSCLVLHSASTRSHEAALLSPRFRPWFSLRGHHLFPPFSFSVTSSQSLCRHLCTGSHPCSRVNLVREARSPQNKEPKVNDQKGCGNSAETYGACLVRNNSRGNVLPHPS